jgi:type IV secretory pathway VirB6-like protein
MKMPALVLTALAVVLTAASAYAFNCPVVIKQAEDLIKKVDPAKLSAETRPLLDEARKQLAEAKAHHEGAKTKRDHGDAIRKAKIAAAFAEEAISLQNL